MEDFDLMIWSEFFAENISEGNCSNTRDHTFSL